ncbi:hypothetical protein [Paenibacillus sp. GCM10012303]|uniref:hypothetical protein n=1 Tax=Paenibacillus sp. GCM10012303 TaxID=3317340 RepID=UPI0036243BDD
MNVYYITPEDYDTARNNGIPEYLVYQRVYSLNWSITRAVKTPVGRRNAWRWSEFKDIAISNGIQYRTYLDRVSRMGWTPEKAASTPALEKKEIRKLAEFGKNRLLSPDQALIAEKNGITRQLAWKRVKELGWDVEKSISTPKVSMEESLKRARASEGSFSQRPLFFRKQKQ